MARQNPKLAFTIIGVVFLTLGIFWVCTKLNEERELSLLAEEGATGTARVLSYEDTGTSHNRVPRVRFQLEIEPDRGGAPLRFETVVLVTPMEAPRLQIGMQRKIRYLPRDPEVFRFLD